MHISATGTFIIDAMRLLSSSRCAACGEPLPGLNTGGLGSLCPACLSMMDALRISRSSGDSAARCARCGLPLISERELCLRCRDRDFSFDSHRAVFMYRGLVKELLQAYKFEKRRELAAVFARFVAESLYECGLEAVTLVPAPPRSSSKRRRGWEHVEDIAGYLERDHGISVRALLSRRGGKAQKRLDYRGRRENMRGRIAASRTERIPPYLVFFDDVFTTGATADECASVLKQSGAMRVEVITVAMD